MRHDYHSAPVANQRLFVFEFLELDSCALARSADQVRQILVREFERQQYSACVLDPEFIADFEQRAGQPLAQSETDEVGVANQQHPPAPDGYIKDPA